VVEAATRVRGPHRQPVEAARPAGSTRWLVGFVLLHLSCQLLLLIPALSGVRVVVRMAAFGVSLAFLVLIPSERTWLTSLRTCAFYILILLGFEFFHPEGSGLLAALAAIMINLAVLAPIFWVPRTRATATNLQHVVTLIWLFYTASAALGVLQAYFPGRFQPPLSAVIAANGRDVAAALEIQLASGERVFRPMGLTDTPGGAAFGGLYSLLLGIGMVLSPKPPFRGARLTAIGSMVVGVMCLYLCQIRSLVVMAGICMVTLLALMALSGRVSRLFGLLAVVGAVIPSAFAFAVGVGGRSMTDRLSTLVESDPGTVYSTNRGQFLQATLRDILVYPFGAGLGRWGMVHAYFGDDARPLWVEIQWTAWLYDGGVLLICLYVAAIGLATWACLNVARGRLGAGDPSLSLWGAVLVAYNVGAVAVCFNAALFGGTGGLEFWLLNMTLICAAHNAERAVPRSTLA
jgi:hypothetical protein